MMRHTDPVTQLAPRLAMGGLCLCLLAALSGCAKEAPLKKKHFQLPKGPMQVELTQAQEDAMKLELFKVHTITMDDKLNCTGQVQAASPLQRHILAPVTGQVLDVPVTLGQFVSPGQTLATLRSDQISQIEDDLLRESIDTQSELHQAQAGLEYSKAAYERERQLFEEGVGAKADMEAAFAQYNKDRENVTSLKIKQRADSSARMARLSTYGISPDTVKAVFRTHRINPYLTITSPQGGLVISRNVNPGELADMSKELFTIADLSRVWITGYIYEKDVSKVHIGQLVNIKLDGLQGKVFEGRVNFVSNLLDPQNRTLEVLGEVPNPQLELKPNMFARMAIDVGEKKVLAVPMLAIQQNGDFMYAYVRLSPHRYEERKVTLGHSDGQFVEIVSGLQPGDEVVTQGSLALKGKIIMMLSDMGQ